MGAWSVWAGATPTGGSRGEPKPDILARVDCRQCKSSVEQGARFCPHCGVPQPQEGEARVSSGVELDLGWGKVVLGDRVGEGGMGVVHRGWLYYNPGGPRPGVAPHPIAVKALHPALKARERARQLFLGEATALAKLSHPNIVHFFELVQKNNQLAIVMEYVDGQSLHEIIARHVRRATPGRLPCMPFARTWHYFSQLLGALAAIHALGIIHRDVKPGNVLIRRDGVCKLTDFGIARVPQEQARNTGGMAPGTGAYMSPEQVTGGELDGRSDLYSAAIVLFEMLTGRTPFDSPQRNELMVRTAQLEESPPPVTQLVPQAPKVMDVLMARALAKDKMHRFGSAIEMGEEFRRALGLADSDGWAAQQKLAENAQAISKMGMVAVGEAADADAEQLRQDVVVAYRTALT